MHRRSSSLAAAAALAAVVAGCGPASEASKERGVLRADGYALVSARADGSNHHWDVTFTVRSAAPGSYVVLFSELEPALKGSLAEGLEDAAAHCPAGRVRRGAGPCTLEGRGEIVGVVRVGTGGTGTVRAAFDEGRGGWLALARVRRPAEERPEEREATFEVQVLSEALTKDEEARRFVLERRD